MDKKTRKVAIDITKLVFLREGMGLNQSALSIETKLRKFDEDEGVSVKTIRRLETSGYATISTIRKLADALGVEPKDLLLRDGESTSISRPDTLHKYQILNKTKNSRYYVMFGSTVRIGRFSSNNEIDIPLHTKDTLSNVAISRLQTEIYFEERYFRLRCVGRKNPDYIQNRTQRTVRIIPGKSVALTDGLNINFAGAVELKYHEYFMPAICIPDILVKSLMRFSSTVSVDALKNRANIEDIPVCCSLYDKISERTYLFAQNAITFGNKSCCIQLGGSDKNKIGRILMHIDGKLLLFNASNDYTNIKLDREMRIGDERFVIGIW